MRDGNGYLYCALVEPAVLNTRHSWDLHGHHHSTDRDDSMLGKVTQAVKNVEFMPLTGIGWPCHVRLQAFYERLSGVGEKRQYLVEATPRVGVGIGVVTNREHDSVRPFRWVFPEDGKLPSEMVKTGVEIGDDVPSQDSYTWRGLLPNLHPKDVVGVFSITVDGSDSWVLTVKNFERLVKSIQVFFRPFQVEPYLGGGVHVLYSTQSN